jgi:LmbE family N-acetylglucosaminyl deacetylase
MKNLTRASLVAVVSVALAGLGPARAGDVAAQLRVRPLDLEDGAVALGLALRQLQTTAVFMQATAHPDDENNALHVYLNRGSGVRTVLATATRGDGGQNEIGPELYDPLAVLRTEELEAMHRFDSTEQYFTRAVDFGYSFSIEESLEKWGRGEIIGDFVRLIRMTRPDVVLGMSPAGTAGGSHHQASGLLSREAFKAAGDASRYPEQIREGLMPWQPRKYYYPLGGPGGGGRGQGAAVAGAPLPLGALKTAAFEVSGFDPLLGRTYVEVGTEERGMHKSQAMGQLLALPSGRIRQRYLLMDSLVPQSPGEEPSLFTGIDTTIPGLAALAAGPPPAALVTGLRAIAVHAGAAQKQFDLEGPFSAAPPILAGLNAVRSLRRQLVSMGLPADARFNIDARLKTKEGQFTEAAVLAHGLRIEVLAEDGVVVPGQSSTVSISIGNRGRPISVASVALDGFAGPATCPSGAVEVESVYRCDVLMRIPANARPSRPYWKRLPGVARYEFEPDAPFGLPFRPTPFRASITLVADGVSINLDRAVQFRYEGANLEGEKRMELAVVPRLALRVAPSIVIVPAAAGATFPVDREVRVTLTNHGKDAVTGQVRLEGPPPGSGVAAMPFSLTREDESQTIRFTQRNFGKSALGDYAINATAVTGKETFETGYQVVEYAHIRRRQLEIPASATMKIMDVRLAPDLNVGYVMGTGDEVPAALRGLGASVRLLDADDLSWADLNGYHAIMIGVRAYDSREDLRANNRRILDYAAAGGIVVVQYNRDSTWTQYAPFPARFSNTRVTDENGPVQILASDDAVFHYPNEIGETAWRNWVQERGTYFIVPDDQRYADLIQVQEPFEHNAGWKTGALVSAPVGEGRWIFVGLGLWRQVAAGTDGAYQLLANLVSQGKLPGVR